jgi:hypothetical protein
VIAPGPSLRAVFRTRPAGQLCSDGSARRRAGLRLRCRDVPLWRRDVTAGAWRSCKTACSRHPGASAPYSMRQPPRAVMDRPDCRYTVPARCGMTRKGGSHPKKAGSRQRRAGGCCLTDPKLHLDKPAARPLARHGNSLGDNRARWHETSPGAARRYFVCCPQMGPDSDLGTLQPGKIAALGIADGDSRHPRPRQPHRRRLPARRPGLRIRPKQLRACQGWVRYVTSEQSKRGRLGGVRRE